MRAALKRARLSADLTVRDVAERLRRAPSFVTRIETGERMLDACEFVDYARAVEADPLDLMAEMMRFSHHKE